MYPPPFLSTLSLFSALHGGRDEQSPSHRVRHGIGVFTAAERITGAAVHLNNVTQRTGGWSWNDLFYAAMRIFQDASLRALLRIRRVATSFSPEPLHDDGPPPLQAHIVIGLVVSIVIRLALVALFMPFSALDKILNPGAAVDQAQGTVHSRTLAWILIGLGLFVEVAMSLAVISGVFDRLAAVILAGYCVVTALLWKQFWKTDDFRLKGPSKGREVFWNFLKNFAVAGGFLILATGGTAQGVQHLIAYPLSSSQPYAESTPEVWPRMDHSSISSIGDSR